MHIGNNGRGAPDWLSVGVNRLARADATEAMVIDDLDDLRFFDALDRLIALVMIHENDLRRLRYDESVTAYETDDAPVFKDRVVAEIGLLHRAFNV